MKRPPEYVLRTRESWGPVESCSCMGQNEIIVIVITIKQVYRAIDS